MGLQVEVEFDKKYSGQTKFSVQIYCPKLSGPKTFLATKSLSKKLNKKSSIMTWSKNLDKKLDPKCSVPKKLSSTTFGSKTFLVQKNFGKKNSWSRNLLGDHIFWVKKF